MSMLYRSAPRIAPLFVVIWLAANFGAGQADEPSSVPTAEERVAWPSLPEAMSSFGAAACDGWLYVYGGHIGTSHEHSKQNLSQRFMRMKLKTPGEWEPLPMGEPLQGMPLVAHEHMVYRVGGLKALNDKGQPENLVSVADLERFDPIANAWQAIQPLPEGRSSHDAVVVDGVLYVLGGWGMNSAAENVWFDHGWKLRLDDTSASWEKVPQPFRRRALSLVANNGQVFALGGLTEKGPTTVVDILDTKTGGWRQGPEIPGKPIDGMACSSITLGDEVYISNMAGGIFRFDGATNAWTEVGKLEHPRFHHRFVPLDAHRFLAVGGASMSEGPLASIEAFDVTR
jgi:Kelch motif protein